MTVYEKIEKIFRHQDVDRPQWADEILEELREIKVKLDAKETYSHVQNHTYKQQDFNEFYAFVKEFRSQMRADVVNNIYPEVVYEGKKYGVNFNGLLYEKSSYAVIPFEQAKKIYRYLYENKRKSV